ncbi:PREDICTED: uncharacterized protein LOC109581920 [Amphimedon queenslandica]|uniref:Uncharacterized protein n=1 Tax=Amphimedon queenslandica TaxID=400682 RepID=A0A1X7UWP3_AMPQE|nr:PREDICTED: uncharacterized protein LOC109581920 [Amphimedon queenslandica]|eukprot:XP_019851980.1 PREDICTED: uncharacterized protein LOC109581920 [Amphimedon queenslandica]
MKTFIVIILIGGLGYVASGEKVQDSNERRTTANNKEESLENRNITNIAGLGDQPAIEILIIFSNKHKVLTVRKFRGDVLDYSPTLDTLQYGDGTKNVTSSLLAYRTNFRTHGQALAAGFLNLEGLFPCSKGKSYVPPCTTLMYEEDGFNNGYPILQAGDSGKTFKVFEGSTYAFAFNGCTRFTATAPCMHLYYGFSVACFLPASCRSTLSHQ